MTQTETIIKNLLIKGWRETRTKTMKARTFFTTGTHRNIYVGKKGSVRIGESYSRSIPISNKSKQALLKTD